MMVQSGFPTSSKQQPSLLVPIKGDRAASPVRMAVPYTHKERMQRWQYRLERLFARQAY
jgi:hypothetical protein